MTPARRQRLQVIIPLQVTRLMLLPLLVASLGACTRAMVARDTLAALDAASVGFQRWDEAHQLGIVEAHPDAPDEARAQVRAYRLERERVLLLFTVAYTAVGLVSSSTTAGPAEALKALADLVNAIKQLQEAPRAPTGNGGGI